MHKIGLMACVALAIKVTLSVVNLKHRARTSMNYRHKVFSCLRTPNKSAPPKLTVTWDYVETGEIQCLQDE